MARDITQLTEVDDCTEFLVMAKVDGQKDLYRLPKGALGIDDIAGLQEELAAKANASDPAAPVTMGYVNAADAALAADITALDGRVVTIEGAGLIPASQKGQPSGVAPLDGDGLVPPEHIPPLDDLVAGLTPAAIGAIPTTEKGAVNGVATLGSDGKVTPAQLPAAGGSIALTEKGVASGVATLDADGKHVLTELQDHAAIDVTSTPYTATRAPGAIRAKSGAARIILPKTGSTRAVTVVNDSGGTLEVIADEGVVALGVKGGASGPTAEYAGIPGGLSSGRRGFTCSWWGYLDLTRTEQRVLSGYRNGSTAYFEVGLIGNAIGFRNANAGGTILNSVQSNWTPAAGLHHFMIAVDLTTSTFQCYVDGLSRPAGGTPVWSNSDISWGTTKFAIANVTSDGAATNGWYDDIYQVWFDDQFVDLSVSGNRDKFYGAAAAVNLGYNGWRPTGAKPALFFDTATFLKNLAEPAETWAAVSGRGSFGATTHSISGTAAAATIVDSGGTSVSAVTIDALDAVGFAGSADGLTWRQTKAGVGGLSGADRTKLDGIEAGAQVNPAVLANVDIDAGTATAMKTITAAGLKRGVQAHAVSGIGARAITAAMLPAAAANSVKGNATGSPGDIADISFSTLATKIGTVPADQLGGYFFNPSASVTQTNPTADGERGFQAANMQPWDATNALTMAFFGQITTAGPAGTKIGVVFENPIGSGLYFWMDGTALGPSGTMVHPADEIAAGIVDAGSATGVFYQAITLPSEARALRRFGWRYYGGNGTGSLVVQGPGWRVQTMLAAAAAPGAGVTTFNGRDGAVVPANGDYAADMIADAATKVIMTAAERSALATLIAASPGLITSVAAEFAVAGGLLSLARIGRRKAYTTAATIGDAEQFIFLQPSTATTYTLSLTGGDFHITNIGTATATIQPGSGQTLRGGNIALPAPASFTAPSTVCIWREPTGALRIA